MVSENVQIGASIILMFIVLGIMGAMFLVASVFV